MIEIVDGKIGGGKTYLAVLNSLKYLASGGTVYSNIEFDIPAVRRYLSARYGVELSEDQLHELPPADKLTSWWEFVRWGTMECPVKVIIDEGHLWYNAHDWKKTQTEQSAMLSFMTQSRKAGVDIVFITQVQGTLNKQFRDQAEMYWTAVNLKKVKLPIVGAIFGNMFYWNCRDSRTKMIMERKFARFRMSIGSCYKTEAMLDAQMQEMARKQKARIKRRKVKRVSIFKRLNAMLELEFPVLLKWKTKLKESKNEIGNRNIVGSWVCLGVQKSYGNG